MDYLATGGLGGIFSLLRSVRNASFVPAWSSAIQLPASCGRDARVPGSDKTALSGASAEVAVATGGGYVWGDIDTGWWML
ncbi:hypothetical protein GCM10023322_32550 [Rugosimonospora acidiphila]|uniref:Uncharacterized protein n=1 Tax=Rugosimonospora acidiphila TaxID=556531 RepID=A0ABP9RSN6_9ACTN